MQLQEHLLPNSHLSLSHAHIIMINSEGQLQNLLSSFSLFHFLMLFDVESDSGIGITHMLEKMSFLSPEVLDFTYVRYVMLTINKVNSNVI